MPARPLCIATRNKHKLEEIRAVLAGLPLEITNPTDYPGCPEVEEDGATLEANAEKKAHWVCAFTGVLTLADDSGLHVDALAGAPGVHSARYAGPGCSFSDNNARLLRELEGVPEERRTARFRCVIALAEPGAAPLGPASTASQDPPPATRPDPLPSALLPATSGLFPAAVSLDPRFAALVRVCRVQWFDGRLEGRIATGSRGRGGFGYDPIFWIPELGCTLAELAPERKNVISHRARALAAAREALARRASR